VTSRAAKPAVKASAVIVMTCAMVASLALPAAAAVPTTVVEANARAAAAVPAVAQAPLAPSTFGSIGFTGVVKPKPVAAPVAVPRRSDRASRSATRAPLGQAAVSVPAPPSGGILGIAASLTGIYYLYGGTTPAGFDCSGYTQYIFGKLGVTLPRTAEQQRQATTPVSNPQPGDMVFFGIPAYHNGIYAGNGMMYDSPRTGLKTALRAIWSSDVTYGRVRGL